MEDGFYEDNSEQDSRKRGISSLLATLSSGFKDCSAAITDRLETCGDKLKKSVRRMDQWADSNRIGRSFGFKERRTKLSTEIQAGTITFLMVAYVLAVNPDILAASGGTCDAKALCPPELYNVLGQWCLFTATNPEALDCLSTLKMDFTTATAATSLISCFIMGFFANLPLALAPGMGINIYVAYQVVGQELLTYQQAMVAIFLEGFIFIFLSMSGVRAGIIRYMPRNISFAASVGIGLLLAFTGLRNLGIIVFDTNTLLTLGACPEGNREYVFTASNPSNGSTFSSPPELNSSSGSVVDGLYLETSSDVQQGAYDVYACSGSVMRSATAWLGIAGGCIMAFLSAWHVKGALFIGIAFVTIISWIPGHAASFLGDGSPIPGGAYRMDVFSEVVAAPSISSTGLAWDWSAVTSGHFWVVLFTFLYIDLLDCTGILLSMAHLLEDGMREDAEEDGALDVYQPFLNEQTKEFAGQQWAFLSDGLGIISASMMGVTPVTVYMESAAGIEDGGRTGIVAIVVSFFFFVSLFFSPIFSSIPPYATGPALVLIGVMLIAHVDRISWDDPLESVPAFLTMIMMPFTFSVAYGVIAGLVSYVLLHTPMWLGKYSRVTYAKYKAKFRPPPLDSEDGDVTPNYPHRPPSQNSSRQLRKRAVHRKTFGDELVFMSSQQAHSEDGNSMGTVRSRNGFESVFVGSAAAVDMSSPGRSMRKTVSSRSQAIHLGGNGTGYNPHHGTSGGGSVGGSWGARHSPTGLAAPGYYVQPFASDDEGIVPQPHINRYAVGAAPPTMSMQRSRTFADLETAAQEARWRHDLGVAGGTDDDMPRPRSVGDLAAPAFNLFGSDFVPLDINLDGDDEEEEEDRDDNESVVVTGLSGVPGDEEKEQQPQLSELHSLDFSTSTGSPEENMRNRDSADLSMFRKSLFANPVHRSAGPTQLTDAARSRPIPSSSSDAVGISRRTNSMIDFSSSISLGSSSLSEAFKAAVMHHHGENGGSGDGGSQPLMRVEGWPEGDSDVPVTLSAERVEQRTPPAEKPAEIVDVSSPPVITHPGSQSQTTASRQLKRIESGAALRLRSLFNSEEASVDGGSIEIPPPRRALSTPASRAASAPDMLDPVLSSSEGPVEADGGDGYGK